MALLSLAAVAIVVLARTLWLTPPSLRQEAALSVVDVDVAASARRLGEAVRFRTVSHQNPQDDDHGQWTALHDWLARSYPAFHAAARREEVGGGALVWTWRGRDPSLQPIILMAHQDVVPVTPETAAQWKAPPFAGVVRDDAVWGRGTIDDKGSLVALMEAGELLARTGFTPPRTIILVSGHDEETRGSGARAVAALLAGRGVKAWFTLDEGSAIVEDHPVTKGPAALIAVAEKGYMTLRLTARGEGGHSSAPPRQTAVSALARAITAIDEHPFAARYDGPTREGLRTLAPYAPFGSRLVLGNDWLFGPLIARQMAASPTAAAGLHTTIAPTMLQGSPKENVLPQRASAWINYRLLPGDTVTGVIARTRTVVGDLPVQVDMVGEGREATPVSSTSSPAYAYLRDAIAAEAPAIPIAPSLMTAGSDSRYLAPVSDNSYRFAAARFRLDQLGMIHGVDEHMTFANLRRSIRFYARLMAGGAPLSASPSKD